jgi:hypothetical protein
VNRRLVDFDDSSFALTYTPERLFDPATGYQKQ